MKTIFIVHEYRIVWRKIIISAVIPSESEDHFVQLLVVGAETRLFERGDISECSRVFTIQVVDGRILGEKLFSRCDYSVPVLLE